MSERKALWTFVRRRDLVSVTSRKIVVRTPGGEIQYGRLSGTLTLWFRGKAHRRVMRRA